MTADQSKGFEIGLEAGIGERASEGVEDVVEGVIDLFGIGKRARVGFVAAAAVAIELQFFEHLVGRRRGVGGFEIGFVVKVRHGSRPRL